jgi:phosphohistidine phosphatase SixA
MASATPPHDPPAPSLRRRSFLAALAAPALAGPVVAADAGLVLAVLVRHAEKGAGDPKDPPLSAAGLARARLLDRHLAAAAPTHLFSSPYARTRATLAPLAERCGLEIAECAAADVALLASRLRALPPGSIAVVAGHSNTIPAVASALGAPLRGLTPEGTLREDEYDRLLVVAIPAGRSGESPTEPAAGVALDLRYGE